MLKGSADVVKYRVGVLKYYTSKWTGEREERLVARGRPPPGPVPRPHGPRGRAPAPVPGLHGPLLAVAREGGRRRVRARRRRVRRDAGAARPEVVLQPAARRLDDHRRDVHGPAAREHRRLLPRRPARGLPRRRRRRVLALPRPEQDVVGSLNLELLWFGHNAGGLQK